MPQAEYDSIIQRQGVHSLVVALSTADMRRAVASDLWLRSLVILLALAGYVLIGHLVPGQLQTRKVDVRLLAATNVDLKAAVAAVLAAGAVTADLGGALGTRWATEAVIDAIRAIHWATAHRVQMHWA